MFKIELSNGRVIEVSESEAKELLGKLTRLNLWGKSSRRGYSDEEIKRKVARALTVARLDQLFRK